MRVRGHFDSLVGAMFFLAILAVICGAAMRAPPKIDAPPLRLAPMQVSIAL